MGKRVVPAIDRIAARSVAGPGGCFLWTGGCNDGGYGVIQTNRVQQYVHRVAYEEWVGPIPDGLVIDHLCHVRRCVNPAHLTATTNEANSGRSARFMVNLCFSRRHELTPENTVVGNKGERLCHECKKERGRQAYQRRRAREASAA